MSNLYLVQMEVAVRSESLEQAVEWAQYLSAQITADQNVAGVTAVGHITAICRPQENRDERQKGKTPA